MSRSWAIWAWKRCRQLAGPGGGVVVLAIVAAVIFASGDRFPVDQQYEVFAINGRPLPLFLLRNGRIVAKYRPTLRVIRLPTGETSVFVGSPCNPWSGRVYAVRLGLFILGGAYQTALGCSPAAMQIEEEFKAAMGKVFRWRLERAQLVLKGNGTEIRLRPTTVAFSQER